jgi:AraC family transcriptional regulator, positive regulator of tynA and feaB
MLQSDDVGGAPLLDFESWRALLRSNCGRDVEVTAPNAFAGWRRPFNVCGLEATSVKIRWGSADPGCSDHRVERYRDVRCDGADHYLILFQVAGQTAMTQMDQAAQLAVGDVALVDAARPVTYLSRFRSPRGADRRVEAPEQCVVSGDWLTLRLPRKSVRSHFGFEPQGGVSRQRTRASRLLFDLIRNADMEAASSSADIYMQFAVYDLVGALFAPSDPRSLARGSDKLFQRICGVIKDGFSDPDFGPVEVAAEAGVSLRYVQKLLTERGTTCSEFIYSSRLDHAAHLLHRRALTGTGQPLSEIAYACGFREYAHFARRFRKRFGYSPGAHAGQGQRAGDGTVRAGTDKSAPLTHDVQAPGS